MEMCCAPIAGPLLDAEEAAHLAAALKAVAEPARLQLLNRIVAAGEVCACELVEPLGLSQPTVSHHLKVLHEAGFLERERRGRWIYYRVVPQRLYDVTRALTPVSA